MGTAPAAATADLHPPSRLLVAAPATVEQLWLVRNVTLSLDGLPRTATFAALAVIAGIGNIGDMIAMGICEATINVLLLHNDQLVITSVARLLGVFVMAPSSVVERLRSTKGAVRGIVNAIRRSLDHPEDALVFISALGQLMTRAPGHAEEAAREGGAEATLQAMMRYPHNEKVQMKSLNAIASMCIPDLVDIECCKESLAHALLAMRTFPSSYIVQEQGLALMLCARTAIPEAFEELVRIPGFFSTLNLAMEAVAVSTAGAMVACTVMDLVCCHSRETSALCGRSSCAQTLLHILKTFPHSCGVQRAGTDAALAVCLSKAGAEKFVTEGGICALEDALNNHWDDEDVMGAILQTLGVIGSWLLEGDHLTHITTILQQCDIDVHMLGGSNEMREAVRRARAVTELCVIQTPGLHQRALK